MHHSCKTLCNHCRVNLDKHNTETRIRAWKNLDKRKTKITSHPSRKLNKKLCNLCTLLYYSYPVVDVG